MSTAPHKNVTLSLPEPLVRKFRVYAATKNQSMSSLMTDAIRGMVDQDDRNVALRKRFIERMQKSPNRGTRGVINWTRDEIHER